MPAAHEANVLATYRTLRVAMIPLLLTLVVAPTLETFRGQTCVLGSVSAYFHTPARGAFVCALAGLGALLIAYKGNDDVEDVLLDFAGFMAFLVALVPTAVDPICADKYGLVVADAGSASGVRNNVATLALVVVVGLVLSRIIPRVVAAATDRSARAALAESSPTRPDDVGRPSRTARILGFVTSSVVIGELGLCGLFPHFFTDHGHTISAVTMVLGVLGVMIANARGLAGASEGTDKPSARHWVNGYSVTAAATLGLIALAVAGLRSSDHLALVVELIVITGFAAFWLRQTRELWNFQTREQKAQAVDRLVAHRDRDQTREVVSAPGPGCGARQPLAPPPVDHQPAAAKPPPSRRDLYRAL